ncbi:MAG TPA: hypothetical protein VLL49_04240, partial [Anaerolineales bacterium]|nr:hypothetical protein [Anaerolineales bacterium]
LGGDAYYGGLVTNTALPSVFDLIITTFLVSTFLCVLLRSFRQLRIVGVLQRQAVNIDLLNLEPAHGFSLLTSRTATGLVLLLVLAYLYDPFKALTAVDLFWYGLTVTLAAAIFSLPIMGLRGRLDEEKRRALEETSRHLRMARELLHSKVSSRDLKDMKEVDAGLESLVRERELYRRVSTWPWDPAAIGGFASALLLPIVLWLITRLLERFF